MVLFSWRSEPVLLRYINGSHSFKNDVHRHGTLSWEYENLEMSVSEPFLQLKIAIRTVYRGNMADMNSTNTSSEFYRFEKWDSYN
jgi:hypothetical protein